MNPEYQPIGIMYDHIRQLYGKTPFTAAFRRALGQRDTARIACIPNVYTRLSAGGESDTRGKVARLPAPGLVFGTDDTSSGQSSARYMPELSAGRACR